MRVIAVLLVITGHALGQLTDQGCTGQTNDVVHEGGDAAILHWSSLKRVKVPASLGNPAVYVFERQVENNSNRAITDIHWPIANFEKDEIPMHEPRCDWSTGLGEQKPDPKGPVYYSVGARSFPTQVYVPEGGFGTTKASVAGGAPELASSIEITDPLSKKPVRVSFRASVAASGTGHQFKYEITSFASDKILVYWYVPMTDDFKALEMGRIPVRAAPGEIVTRAAHSGDAVAWTTAQVQIFDFDKRWLATGVASAYCSLKGKAEPLLETAPRKAEQ
jgi:hypothetical protein